MKAASADLAAEQQLQQVVLASAVASPIAFALHTLSKSLSHSVPALCPAGGGGVLVW